MNNEMFRFNVNTETVSIRYSPAGKYIASCGWYGKIYIWDIENKKLFKENIKPFALAATCITFYNDNTFAVGGKGLIKEDIKDGGRVSLWKIDSDEPERSYLAHRGSVSCAVFSQDLHYLLIGTDDWKFGSLYQPPELQLLNVKDGNVEKKILGHEYVVTSVSFVHKLEIFISSSIDRTVRIWDAHDSHEVKRIICPDPITKAIYLAEQDNIITSDTGGSIRIWDRKNGKEIRNITAHPGRINTIALSKDGRYLASGGDDQKIKIWNIFDEYKEIVTFEGHEQGVADLDFSPNNESMASCSWDKSIRIWKLFR